MKGLKIALIAVLCGLIAFLSVGMVRVINGDWYGFGYANGGLDWGNRDAASHYTLQRTTEKDMTGVKELYIDCDGTASDVLFYPGVKDMLVVEEYFQKKEDEDLFADITQKDGALTIYEKPLQAVKHRWFFGWSSGNYYRLIKIYLPAEAYTALEKLKVTTSSGDISLPDWEGKAPDASKRLQVELKSSSGDILTGDVTADKISFEASSGDITVRRAEGRIKVNTSSGNINVKEAAGAAELNSSSGDQTVTSMDGDLIMNSSSGEQTVMSMDGKINMHSSSGGIYVKRLSGQGKFAATSGDITVCLEEQRGDISAKTSSGEVYVKGMSEQSAFRFQASTNSGDINTGFDEMLDFDRKGRNADGTVGAPSDAKYLLEAETSSGDISVY